ncbi:MAG TPA: Na+/H+ antiporter subunit E [Reyranella sp.]|nr:Na+/H+ antiporter subunit E [Reyranella sp.]
MPLVGFAEESKVSGEKPVGVGDALHRSSRIFILSSARDDDAPRPAWVAAGRAILFLAFWLMIAGYDPADLPVGLIAAAAATWTSLRLLPSVKVKVRLLSLATFILHFLRQSVSSGVEVAWRAFDPRLPINPGFVVYPCRLRSAGSRSAFCALSSLLPGTLPAGSDEEGALVVHCLDVGQPVAANLAAEEALFSRAIGHD